MELGIAVPPWAAAYTLSTAVVLNKLEPAFVLHRLICGAEILVALNQMTRHRMSST